MCKTGKERHDSHIALLDDVVQSNQTDSAGLRFRGRGREKEIRAGSVELIAVRFFVEGNRWYDGAGLGFIINGR